MHILASKYKAHKELGITHELFSMLSVVMIIIRKDSASTRGVSQYIIEAHENSFVSRPVKRFVVNASPATSSRS